MIDLHRLAQATFCVDDEPRLAFVHHGFRSTLLEHGEEQRARFASRYPPLGILALIRQLEHDQTRGALRAPVTCKYFDEAAYSGDEALAHAVLAWLAPSRFRVLLIGVYTVSLDRVERFLARFNGEPVCIIVGGPHVTAAPDVAGAHLAVRGEGGAALRHVVNFLFRTGFGAGADAKGLCYLSGGVATVGKPAFDRSLAEVPAPAYDFRHFPVAPRAHWVRDVGEAQQIYVCTQSCGARCTFCSTYLIHGNFVSRPVSLVRRDLEAMVRDFGYDAIEFHDDDLLQHEQLEELLDVLEELPLRWSCNARSELVTDELATRMYAAGCRRVYLGLEAMNQETLDYFRKGCTVSDNERAVYALHRAGVSVLSGFVIGAPDHSVASILTDFDTFLAMPLFYLGPSILTPDIGTVEYRRARRRDPRLRLLESDSRGVSIHPRPELFGTQTPYGMPTVCANVDKGVLNELADLIRCEFILRDATLARVLEATAPRLHAFVRDWYLEAERAARDLLARAECEAVRERIGKCLRRWSGLPVEGGHGMPSLLLEQ